MFQGRIGAVELLLWKTPKCSSVLKEIHKCGGGLGWAAIVHQCNLWSALLHGRYSDRKEILFWNLINCRLSASQSKHWWKWRPVDRTDTSASRAASPLASRGISYPVTGYPHTARCGKVRSASSSFGHNKGEGEEEEYTREIGKGGESASQAGSSLGWAEEYRLISQ